MAAAVSSTVQSPGVHLDPGDGLGATGSSDTGEATQRAMSRAVVLAYPGVPRAAQSLGKPLHDGDLVGRESGSWERTISPISISHPYGIGGSDGSGSGSSAVRDWQAAAALIRAMPARAVDWR
jgi:hypothetical protein